MINFLLGKVSIAPRWYYKLPLFFQAIYTGHKSFRWMGVEWSTPDGTIGDTLFEVRRKRRNVRLQD